MRVTRQAPSSATARLVFQLKAKTQDEGDDTFDTRLAVAKQLNVGRFALKIDGDGPVFAGLADGVLPGPPSGQMVEAADDLRWG